MTLLEPQWTALDASIVMTLGERPVGVTRQRVLCRDELGAIHLPNSNRRFRSRHNVALAVAVAGSDDMPRWARIGERGSEGGDIHAVHQPDPRGAIVVLP